MLFFVERVPSGVTHNFRCHHREAIFVADTFRQRACLHVHIDRRGLHHLDRVDGADSIVGYPATVFAKRSDMVRHKIRIQAVVVGDHMQQRSTPLVDAGSPRKCSACGVALTVTSVWLQCSSCRGIFIGFDRVRELVEMLEVANVPTSFPRLETALTLLLRLCPNCGFAMQQHEFFRQAVDVCLDHGIWFDVPELENAAAKMQQLLIQMRVHHAVI